MSDERNVTIGSLWQVREYPDLVYLVTGISSDGKAVELQRFYRYQNTFVGATSYEHLRKDDRINLMTENCIELLDLVPFRPEMELSYE